MDRLTEDDSNAYSGKPRSGQQHLPERIGKDDADVLLVWHPGRLHRSLSELEAYIRTREKHGVRALIVKAGVLSLATPGRRLTSHQTGSCAC